MKPQLLTYQHIHLVGVKGVAMASLAQCLADANITVSGSDVAEDFVTKELVEQFCSNLQIGFKHSLPEGTDAVVYTSAHNGPKNPQVQNAQQQGLPTFSHAEALANLFNAKHGIAVCGVGGKSTTSAMITWIMSQAQSQPSFSVGVGAILGMDRTGQWRESSDWFVAEADEYVTDTSAPERGEAITPRFSYLKPAITVCTNIGFDHPDVYKNFEHTQTVFSDFFKQIKPNGKLIFNGDNETLRSMVSQLPASTSSISYGFSPDNDWVMTMLESKAGETNFSLTHQNTEHSVTLQIPGKYNAMNAAAAIIASLEAGMQINDAIAGLQSFRSTLRRAEHKLNLNQTVFYDDYAHHPSEISAVIQAFKNWYPDHTIITCFQPHTYSRTKQLLNEFAESLRLSDQVLLLPIFASAREQSDESISSEILAGKIGTPTAISVIADKKSLAEQLLEIAQNQTQQVVLTLGAGDIYEVYEYLQS